MSIVFTLAFGGIVLGAYYAVEYFKKEPSAAAHSGGFGVRLNDAASAQYCVLVKRLATALDDSYTRFSVRFSGMTGSPTVAYGRDDSSSAVRWILYYDARSQSLDYYIFNGAG